VPQLASNGFQLTHGSNDLECGDVLKVSRWLLWCHCSEHYHWMYSSRLVMVSIAGTLEAKMVILMWGK